MIVDKLSPSLYSAGASLQRIDDKGSAYSAGGQQAVEQVPAMHSRMPTSLTESKQKVDMVNQPGAPEKAAVPGFVAPHYSADFRVERRIEPVDLQKSGQINRPGVNGSVEWLTRLEKGQASESDIANAIFDSNQTLIERIQELRKVLKTAVNTGRITGEHAATTMIVINLLLEGFTNKVALDFARGPAIWAEFAKDHKASGARNFLDKLTPQPVKDQPELFHCLALIATCVGNLRRITVTAEVAVSLHEKLKPKIDVYK